MTANEIIDRAAEVIERVALRQSDEVEVGPRQIAGALADAGLLAEPKPVKHYRVGPGACACGFDAYKLSEFIFDYGDRLDVHIRGARR